jgi:type III pantothenate kinase
VGLTVVEGGLDPARTVLTELGIPLAQVGADVQVPLRVVYKDPSTLGLDRLVGALAAQRRHGRGVVVDLGTAVTVSLVRDGVFLGGAIAPGPVAMARGLAASAPALPRVDLAAAIRLPAESSADAVNAGVLVGFRGLVEGLVHAVAAAADLSDAPHLLTGGQAGLYLDLAPSGPEGGLFEHVPDLVHQGLRWLASEGM